MSRSVATTYCKQLLQTSELCCLPYDLSEFPVEKIRNFSIIAHVDHGKSTLADRLLELTGVIPKTNDNQQVLDRLQVERERGITVKAQTVSLFYEHHGQTYLLNLIDTPGHVDFNYEVARSLSACQGVILLVDANQGVQAQTVANFYLAFESELTVIPVLNKIDLKLAKPDEVLVQMKNVFDISPQEVLKISAKHGTGVEDILKAVIDKIPPPTSDVSKPLKALLFDSWFDQYKGVIIHMVVIDGLLKKGDKIASASSHKVYEVHDVGVMHPLEVSTNTLYAGQVGYVITNMRNTNEAQVGDTFYHENIPVEALPEFKSAKPMVFAGIFPSDQSEYNSLRSAIQKLTLTDASVSIHSDSSPALGQGWRLGFLGLLHMEVFNQRLEQEHNASVIVTSPNVPYKVKIHGAKNIKKYGAEEIMVLNPCNLPDKSIIADFQEPVVMGTIIMPDDYLGNVTNLILDRRGLLYDQTYIDDKRIMVKAKFPLSEILIDFFDELKSMTSGYASFDYEDLGFESSSLIKVNFLLNGSPVDELSLICHTSKARSLAKHVCAKLKDIIPRQLFLITLQGAVGSKILSREDIRPLRKDVLAKCYGGDVTRKMKLLKRQAEGKKKMRKIGNVEIPRDAFIKALKR
ncbi:translation factor Guf1, mitochondrial-like isoform X2 [Gigantopelta aegis]|uniref:translation factor Guf1, mitochondrial-like isoform X2 n=1 Tax=Gigantopelta aegis TaxID=1735272 RepID=UPI001B888682|nr:translation factor Guf1, mitochondrial-like isoform X2 [Gigantopelta aegis]